MSLKRIASRTNEELGFIDNKDVVSNHVSNELSFDNVDKVPDIQPRKIQLTLRVQSLTDADSYFTKYIVAYEKLIDRI